MSTLTTINGIQKPQLSDAANIETAVGTGLDTIDGLLVARFSTLAARNAAIPSPINGMQVWCDETGEMYLYISAWTGLLARRFRKTSTQSIATTTLTNVTDMAFTVEVNSIYELDVIIEAGATASNAPDIKIDWTVPTSATMLRFCRGPNLTTTDVSHSNVAIEDGVHINTTAVGYGLVTGGSDAFISEKIELITAGTAGTVQMRFAQNTSTGGSNVNVAAGSRIFVRKVG